MEAAAGINKTKLVRIVKAGARESGDDYDHDDEDGKYDDDDNNDYHDDDVAYSDTMMAVMVPTTVMMAIVVMIMMAAMTLAHDHHYHHNHDRRDGDGRTPVRLSSRICRCRRNRKSTMTRSSRCPWTW